MLTQLVSHCTLIKTRPSKDTVVDIEIIKLDSRDYKVRAWYRNAKSEKHVTLWKTSAEAKVSFDLTIMLHEKRGYEITSIFGNGDENRVQKVSKKILDITTIMKNFKGNNNTTTDDW